MMQRVIVMAFIFDVILVKKANFSVMAHRKVLDQSTTLHDPYSC